MQPVSGARPAQFRLVDNVTVRVTFNRSESFVSSWVFGRSQQFQLDMLNHEQGHYDLTALVSRDFFIDIMLLKTQTFPTAPAGLAAAKKIQQGSLDKIRTIQQLYDKEVHPEQDSGKSRGPVQQAWDGFIRTAFTTSRSTGTQAPDGTFHKVRLIDTLTQGGKQI